MKATITANWVKLGDAEYTRIRGSHTNGHPTIKDTSEWVLHPDSGIRVSPDGRYAAAEGHIYGLAVRT